MKRFSLQLVISLGTLLNTATATINCKLARQLCIEDQVCRSITDILPRLCGQQLVSCSTVTVTKCQAALRTLVAFPYFQPTCLCKEPRLDPECNTYRNIIFDHPCFSTKKKDKDPYPIHALPTCDYAMDACQRETTCSTLYDQYLSACKVDNGTCLMENSDRCYWSWTKLRMSPLFGCVCPNFHDQACRSVFAKVHNNTCIEWISLLHHPSPSGLLRRSSTTLDLHQLLHPPAPVIAPVSIGFAPGTILHAAPLSQAITVSLNSPTNHVSVNVLRTDSGAAKSAKQHSLGHNPLKAATLARDNAMRAPPVDQWASHAEMYATLYGEEIKSEKMDSFRQSQRHKVLLGSGNEEPEVYQSSCHLARDRCLQNEQCGAKLGPMLSACGASSCHRKLCMQRLRNFYSLADKKMGMEIAFCVCRRNPSGSDDCLTALQQLHPPCAQQADSSAAASIAPPSPTSTLTTSSGDPNCSWLVYSCRRRGSDGGVCRHLLEQFEQACAVDAVSERCAGPHEDCRLAVMAILGTQLKSSCSCLQLGNDKVRRECQSWRALLWNNPCVDEAQRHFHRQIIQKQNRNKVTSPTPKPTMIPSSTHRSTTLPPFTYPPPSTLDDETAASTDRNQQSWSTSVDLPHRSHSPAVPDHLQSFCVARKHGRIDDRIPVGSGIRYYLQDRSVDKYSEVRDCSELCMCYSPSQLVCNVLECTPQRDCHSAVAMYPHGAAGLLPYREGCICYRGDFVCMRPPADQFTLPYGVFLFLGFSAKDEAILHPYTHKTMKNHVVDEVTKLLALLMKNDGYSIEDWPCSIEIFQYFELTENVILQAKLDAVEQSYNDSISPQMLLMEKEECSRPLREVSYMINNRAAEIISHPLLSIVKMADIVVFLPATSSAPPPCYWSLAVLPTALCSVLPTVLGTISLVYGFRL